MSSNSNFIHTQAIAIKEATGKLNVNFVGSRTGATGTLDDLKATPPVPKAWVKPHMLEPILNQLKAKQSQHSRIDLFSIIHNNFFDTKSNRFRIVWSKNMISAAGVTSVQRINSEPEFAIHFRDGEEERKENQRFMRQIIEGLFAKGGRGKDSVDDFLYLLLVHEASEIHQRKKIETLAPNMKAEVRALVEEAKAYFSLSAERRKTLFQLSKLLDETADVKKKPFSAGIETYERIGKDTLGTIDGLLILIDYVLETPDYVRERNQYHDDRTKLQLARSLFVDILHDFAGSSEADNWVRLVESIDDNAESTVTFNYSENSKKLSDLSEEVFIAAARILNTLKQEGTDTSVIPSKSQKKRVIDGFNKQLKKLDEIKSKLEPNEVLSIPNELRTSIEDNEINRHFSYMDEYGIYNSLNLSRLDLRGINVHSGYDDRTASDKDREINKHKDERTDLRGAHLVGCDISERANFSAAQLDFAIASYSNLREVIFTRTKAIGIVLYGANADEAQFEHARMTAADARGMSASFARIQMKETDINGLKIWQSDVPSWQRAYVDISRRETTAKANEADTDSRESLKAELDFLEDSFLDELDAIEDVDSSHGEEKWIELREIDGQLELLKGRGVVFYSRDEKLEYSPSASNK